MHRSPFPDAEQVSQGLLGEPVTVLVEEGDWLRIRTPDGYEGWARAAGVVATPAEQLPRAEILPLWANLRRRPDYRLAAEMTAFAASQLPIAGEEPGWIALQLPEGSVGWTERHRVRLVADRPAAPASAPDLLQTAERFLGVPYLWGGCTPLGIDCSGFVQLVWRLHGVVLPRDAWMQAELGSDLDVRSAGPADLFFFGPEEGGAARIAHVGISLDGERMIHAAGSDCVRVDAVHSLPYRHRLLFARRLLDAP
jgi:gamma-D-glutamyl-L-lysine dipeptidyl-peptidase